MSFDRSDHNSRAVRIEQFSPKLDEIIAPEAFIEILVQGFAWTEGPAWDRQRRLLYFSDIPNNTIHTWSRDAGLGVYLNPAGRQPVNPDPFASPGTNGLYMKSSDELLICNQDARSVDLLNLETGQRQIVAARFNDKPFNSPNDVISSPNGHVYFTDPPFGLKDQQTFNGMELGFHGVYRVRENGEVTLEIEDMNYPNGLVFSPDGRSLYVSQSDPKNPIIKKFDVDADGRIGTGVVFYNSLAFSEAGEPGLPDGMTVDLEGNLFATIAGGVAILSPQGDLLGRIATGKATANCTFGEEGNTLFITAHDTLIRVIMKTKGVDFQ